MHPDLLKAKRKHHSETYAYLADIESLKKFKIVNSFPSNDKKEIEIQKGERCYIFNTESLNLINHISDKKNNGFRCHKPFNLVNKKLIWKANNGASTMTHESKEKSICHGEIWEIENEFIVNKPNFFRLIIPKVQSLDKRFHSFIQSEPFHVDNSTRLAGLSVFQCNDKLFNLFDSDFEDRKFLFLDSMMPMKYAEFEKSIAAIMYSLAIITGYLLRDEIYILQAKTNEFRKFTGFQFRRIEDTIISGMEVVSPKLHSEITGKVNLDLYVSTHILSNMSTNAIKDKRFLRALKIISESNNYPLEIRASSYSVALETIKNIIIEENEEKINPFKVKKFASNTIKDLKRNIEILDESNFNSKNAVLNRIEQLNKITNTDSLKIVFEICDFKLTDIDKEALKKRDDFLHGRIPFEDEEESKQSQELKFITYKLHFLVTALIMKYSKFEGLLKNNPKYFSVYASDNKEVDEPLFRLA